MNATQKYLLAGLLAILGFPLIAYSITYFLLKFKIINEYGYTGIKSLAWLYNLFSFRDGLYTEPNFLFYLFSYGLAIYLFKKVLDLIYKVQN